MDFEKAHPHPMFMDDTIKCGGDPLRPNHHAGTMADFLIGQGQLYLQFRLG